MAREYRLLHHRQAGSSGGHWDLVENPIPYRTSGVMEAPHGEGSLCGALAAVAEEGWIPIMEMTHAHSQSGETFILVGRS